MDNTPDGTTQPLLVLRSPHLILLGNQLEICEDDVGEIDRML